MSQVLPRHLAHILVFSTYLVLAFRLFRMVFLYAVNIFAWDQWGFNDATLFQKHSLWQVFRWQWGPHREGIGGVLSKLLEPSIRWNSRYEDFGIATIILVAAVLALFLKKRLFGTIGYEDIIIPLLFLTPVQYENLIAAEGPTPCSLPLLLMIVYCISWTIDSHWWKYFCVLLVNFFLIYTGYGIFIGLVTPCLIIFDYYRNTRHLARNYHAASAVALALSLASLLSFFIGYKVGGVGVARTCSLPQMKNAVNYFWFMDLMFATFVGAKADRPGKLLVLAIIVGGIILLSTLIALLFFVGRLFSEAIAPWKTSVVVNALLGYSLLFCLTAAFGRLCLGLGLAESSRYMTHLILAFFGLYLGALSMRSRNWRATYVSALFAVAMLSSAGISSTDRVRMNEYAKGKRAWRECYLTRHNIEECNTKTQFQIIPWADHSFIDDRRLQEKLDFLERNHLNLYSDPNSGEIRNLNRVTNEHDDNDALSISGRHEREDTSFFLEHYLRKGRTVCRAHLFARVQSLLSLECARLEGYRHLH